jgi:hypothetical protein
MTDTWVRSWDVGLGLMGGQREELRASYGSTSDESS